MFDLACVSPAYQAVVIHLAGALFDGERVPVLVFAAAAVHGIEAQVAIGWNLGVQARAHRFAVASELAFDFGFPLVGVWLDVLIGKLLVDFESGVVESEFDDGQVRSGGLEVVAQTQVGEFQFGLVQVGEGLTEVDEHQVALVPDQRVESGLAGGVLFHSG